MCKFDWVVLVKRPSTIIIYIEMTKGNTSKQTPQTATIQLNPKRKQTKNRQETYSVYIYRVLK